MAGSLWRPARTRRLEARLAPYRPVQVQVRVASARADWLAGAVNGLSRLFDPLLGRDRRSCVDETITALPAVLAGVLAGAAAVSVLHLLLALSMLPVAIGAGLAALGGIRLWVARRRDAGKTRVEEQFALALGVIIRCVRAGLPVVEAMRVVGSEVPAPTGREFGRCVDQMRLGEDFDAALAGLADRCPLADYRFFGVTVSLQRQTGGNLAETLDNLAETIRRRRAVQMKAGSLTAEIRATVAVLALLPLGVGGLMLVVSPGYVMQLFVTENGRLLLGIAMVVQAIGLFIIRQITRRTLG